MAVEAARANDHSKTLLYAADMKLASDAIANEDLLRARELLARHVPTAEEKDLRGFEWQLFQKRLAQDADVTLNQGVRIQDAEFSPDGKWLATTAVSGGVDVYATDSWKQFRSFHTTAELVNGFAWSPNSGLLAAACADGNLFIWDLMTGSQRLRISAHEGEANDVVFSPDARHLYSGGDDHLAVKWGVETGEQQLVFSGHSRAVERISMAPYGKTLATSGENYSLWDTGSGKRLRSFSHDIARVLCVAFSPDGRFVAAGDLEGHVYLTDCETGESQTLAHQADAIEALTFFADGQWLATADRGGAIQLHRLPKSLDEMLSASAAQSPRWIAHEDRALAITASPDGRRIVSGGRDSLLRSWTPDLHACRWSVGQDHYHSIAVGPNNRLYAAGHKIHVFDLTDRRLIDAFAPADPLWERVECTADGRFLAAVRAGELALFELASSQMVRKWSLDKQHIQPHRMAISSDGKVIALAVYPPKVLLYQTESQSPPVRLPMRLCDALAFAPEKQLLAAGYGDVDDLHLFDLKSGGAARVLEGHTSTLSGVAFSPDGSLLATVSHDRLLKVWRLDTGEEIFSIVAHRASILSVSFAPDGKTIVTGAKDGLVKFWHTATGQPLGTLPSGRVGVDKLCFNGGDQLCALINGKVVIHDASAIPRTPAEVVASGISMDNTVEFRGLGDLPGGETWSVAMGVSSDGRFVVGRSYTESDYDPFLWTSQGGMRSHNRFHREGRHGLATCVSDDGRVLCGAGASKGESKAARLWIGEQPSINIAPHWSIAEGMSADGSVVVGYQFFKGTCSAFRWCSGETQLLQASSQHRYSIARAVTRDGNTALGMVFNTAGSWRKNREDHALVRNACPVIWDAQGLRFLSGFDPGFNWWPYDLSDDGSVVVGLCWEQSAESPNSVEHRKEWAFVWRSGQVTLLEPLPGYSGGNARRVSGDGRVIIGYSDGYKRPWAAPGPGNQAWIWDAVHGVRNLRELLARHGLALDWHLFDAIDLSEDCRTLVGSGVNPAREREAWRARLPADAFD